MVTIRRSCRRGYHPILATRAETGEVLHARMRKGSAPVSAVWKVLRRTALPSYRRYEWSRPGALLHMDVKRLARFSSPATAAQATAAGAAARSATTTCTASSTTTPASPTSSCTHARTPTPTQTRSSAHSHSWPSSGSNRPKQ